MKKFRVILFFVLVIGIFCGLSGISNQRADYLRGQSSYDSARKLAGMSSDPADILQMEAEPGSGNVEEDSVSFDLAALQAVNSDIIGWISIPGTELSYPLLQGMDNEYYLVHTWNGEPNSVGSVFLDYRSDAAFGNFNTLIYGHRMRDNSMFGILREYEDQSFWEQAPILEVADADGVHYYQIFAAYQAKTDAALYQPGESSQDYAEEVLRYAREHSVLDTGIFPDADDRIVTLVTCTGRGYSARWIVQAVRSENAAKNNF